MDIKLENTNCALIGSLEDLQQRIKAAKTEKEWEDAGKEVGIQIWRVEKFNIKKWPKSRYGEFFDGDCYIILWTYKKPGSSKHLYNVHFWLGQNSTQDERGVAAYKTVELDDLLGTLPVQFREIQGCESEIFMNYFPNKAIFILKGGIESGFNHVEPKKYIPKLFHIKGKRRVQIMETARNCGSLNFGDAFVLDAGLDVFLWLPRKSGAVEKFRANLMANKIKSERKGVKFFWLDDDGRDEKGKIHDRFWELLGGNKKKEIKSAESVEVDSVFDNIRKQSITSLWNLVENKDTKKIEFKKVENKKKKLEKSILKSEEVFIIDVGSEILVWIGLKAPKSIRTKSILYAQNYMGVNKKPIWLPIIRIVEGSETKRFWNLFEGKHTKKKKDEKKKSEDDVKMPSSLLKKDTWNVEITIHSCKNLIASDVNKSSDPYVMIKTSKNELVKSKEVPKNLNPVFEEKHNFIFRSDPNNTVLKVRVFDKDWIGKDDKLGKVDIPLTFLPKNKAITREYKLQKVKQGSIKLTLCAKDFGLEQKSDTIKPNPILPTVLINLDEVYVDPGEEMKTFSPYVIFKYGGKYFKSSVAKKCNTPKWENETFAIRLDEKNNPNEEVLRVVLKHENKLLIKHNSIGKAMIPIGMLPYERTVKRRIPLYKNEKEIMSYVILTMKIVDFGDKKMDFF